MQSCIIHYLSHKANVQETLERGKVQFNLGGGRELEMKMRLM